MKKKDPPSVPTDDLQPEYQRSDFTELVRGKYIELLKKKPNVDS
jgi:hypothetical protein